MSLNKITDGSSEKKWMNISANSVKSGIYQTQTTYPAGELLTSDGNNNLVVLPASSISGIKRAYGSKTNSSETAYDMAGFPTSIIQYTSNLNNDVIVQQAGIGFYTTISGDYKINLNINYQSTTLQRLKLQLVVNNVVEEEIRFDAQMGNSNQVGISVIRNIPAIQSIETRLQYVSGTAGIINLQCVSLNICDVGGL